MNNDQKELNAKILQISKKQKLQPKYYQKESHQIIFEAIIRATLLAYSPIIVIASPIWIPFILKDFLKCKLLNYKCQNFQKELLKQKDIPLSKIDQAELQKYISNTYPIAIYKHKGEECQMIIFAPKFDFQRGKKTDTRWSYVSNQFKEKKKQSKQSVESMFFFAGNQLLNGMFTIEDIYNKWKSQDNVLYVRYQKLQVFG